MTTLLNNILQSNTTAAVATQSYVQTALTQSGALAGFRNLVVNGDMKLSQRATSGALTTGQTYMSLDRWSAYQGTTAAGVLAQVSTGVPTGFQYAMKLGRNNAATSTGVLVVSEVFETITSIPLQGQTVTLSFYAKAGANYSGGVLTGAMFTGNGVDQSSATIGAWTGLTLAITSSNTLSTTWQRYTVTGTLSSTMTQVAVQFSWNPTGTAGADDNVYITGVQLEVGSVATPFELRPIQSELALCQRYYQRHNQLLWGGAAQAGNTIWTSYIYPTQMRSAPAVNFYNQAYSGTSTLATVVGYAPTADRVSVQTSVSGTGGGIVTVYAAGDIELIAEL